MNHACCTAPHISWLTQCHALQLFLDITNFRGSSVARERLCYDKQDVLLTTQTKRAVVYGRFVKHLHMVKNMTITRRK